MSMDTLLVLLSANNDTLSLVGCTVETVDQDKAVITWTPLWPARAEEVRDVIATLKFWLQHGYRCGVQLLRTPVEKAVATCISYGVVTDITYTLHQQRLVISLISIKRIYAVQSRHTKI